MKDAKITYKMYGGRLCIERDGKTCVMTYNNKSHKFNNNTDSVLFKPFIVYTINAAEEILRSEDPERIYNLLKIIDNEYYYNYNGYDDKYLSIINLAKLVSNTSLLYTHDILTEGYKCPIYNHLKGYVLPLICDMLQEYIFSYQNEESKSFPVFENSMEITIQSMYKDRDELFTHSDVIAYNHTNFTKSKRIPMKYLSSISDTVYTILINIPINMEDRSEIRYYLIMNYYTSLGSAIDNCNATGKEYSVTDIIINLRNDLWQNGNTGIYKLYNEVIGQFKDTDFNVIKDFEEKFGYSIFIED